MADKVSILLINYNGLKYNQACIDSLLQQTYTNFEIIFLDNASQDRSVQQVENIFKKYIEQQKIKIIKNKQNDGFAQGNNIAAQHVDPDSKYICLLNNDTVVEKNRLEELVKVIQANKDLGAVGSLVLDQGMEQQLQDFYFKQHKGTHNNYIFETSFRKLSRQEIQSGIFQTTGIGGCSLLYRKSLIDQPFPDFYFGYAEDTFLCMCILMQGYQLALVSKSIVHHFGSGSFGKKLTAFKAFHGTKNHLCNILLLHNSRTALRVIPIFLLHILSKSIVSHPSIRFPALIKSIRRCIHNRKIIKQEKYRIQKYKKISNKHFIKKLSSTIFENIYFINMPKYQIAIMHFVNVLCKIYFKIVGLGRGR